MHRNQQTDQEYQKKLWDALAALGLHRHYITLPNSREVVELLYDCQWCGCLVSKLDIHAEKCPVMSDELQAEIAADTERAVEIIVNRLEHEAARLSSEELQHLRDCGRGPHTGRLELLGLCEDQEICAYAYSLAEQRLVDLKKIGYYEFAAHPPRDLQVYLLPAPEPAEV